MCVSVCVYPSIRGRSEGRAREGLPRLIMRSLVTIDASCVHVNTCVCGVYVGGVVCMGCGVCVGVCARCTYDVAYVWGGGVSYV